ncbi:upstream stimulatory factor 2 isoform X1 [Myxocyprinus asiaticus]|uniref:upstream stimulatory factor 2 isoform X1 n=2 Tax=Myxocyprinus asiaticus TaxID=70543 RepID=UPI0022213B0A|nr:upstream stimulatory factor 2 isoform X1 [Myxocyprinus asiaticus]
MEITHCCKVTYRVSDQQLQARGEGAPMNVVSTANISGAQHAFTQTVIQNSFSNGGSSAGEGTGNEAQCAYYSVSSVSEGTAPAVSMQASTDPALTQTAGQFYVMMTPTDILHSATQRTIAPRTQPYTLKMDSPHTPRDERRRAQHNEVERRRRDKINNWIVTLSNIIPDCNLDSTKTGGSKGGILSKACDYISELKQNNQRLQESLRELERVHMDNELLRQQLEELKNENALLRAQLEQNGIETVTDTPAQ